MSKLSLRETPDFSDLMQDVDDALSGDHRAHVLKMLWGRLFEEIPAAHLRLQVKDKNAPFDSENENTKIVIQTGRTIKFLADEESPSGFENIETLQSAGETNDEL